MMDAKATVGTVLTTVSAWVDWAEPMAQLVVTLLVGGLTAWYTWERAMKLRHERRERRKQERNDT